MITPSGSSSNSDAIPNCSREVADQPGPSSQVFQMKDTKQNPSSNRGKTAVLTTSPYYKKLQEIVPVPEDS